MIAVRPPKPDGRPVSLQPERWAAEYIGLPYKDGGRDRAGIDCWGLLRLVRMERVRNAPVLPAYDGLGYDSFRERAAVGHEAEQGRRQKLAAFMAEHMRSDQAWRRLDVDPHPSQAATWSLAEPGDGVLLRFMGHPIHVGVCVGAPWFLHIEEGIDSASERWDEARWVNRLIGVYRWEEAP